MDDNPYKSPQFLGPAEPKPGTWHPLTWAVVGFAGGTGFMAPLLLSVAGPISIKAVGAVLGGIVGATYGLAHGVERRW